MRWATRTLLTLAFLILIYTTCNYCQSNYTEEYKEGIVALNAKDTLAAESYFKESINSNRDSHSFYQLGKMELSRNTFQSRNKALDYFKNSALREPKNFEYRFAYASLLVQFARNSAVNELEDINALFPDNPRPLILLGDIKLADYIEYKDAKKFSELWDINFDFDLADEALKDFTASENYYSKVLKIDSLNSDAFWGLSRLYGNSPFQDKALLFLRKICRLNPSNKDAHLFLGLIYNKRNKLKQAADEFQKALDLMSETEREDFIYNSVVVLLSPKYDVEKLCRSKGEIEDLISRFWEASNPLYLSENNERLLEHYARMAYANLQFSIPKLGIDGWKTDRGETLIRYGPPNKITRVRAHLDNGGTFYAKTDIWSYSNASLSFDDYNMNGNMQLSWDRGGKNGRFQSNPRSLIYSYELFQDTKEHNIQAYKPKGKRFELNFQIYDFVNTAKQTGDNIDSYLVYELPIIDTLGRTNIPAGGFVYDVRLFDKSFYSLYTKRDSFNKSQIDSYIHGQKEVRKISSIEYSLTKDSISFAFEAMRLPDSTYCSYHFNYVPEYVHSDNLIISDVIIASQIEQDEKIIGAINRGGYSVLPRLDGTFSNGEPVFLYYEMYGLKKDAEGTAKFEQIITVRDHIEDDESSGLKSFWSGVKHFLFGSGVKVSLTSDYSVKETNPVQYLQLDLSKYPAGKYDVIVTIQDRNSGSKVEKSAGMITVTEKSGE